MPLNTTPAIVPIAKCLALLLGCMLVGGVAQAQVPPPTLGHAFAWNYLDQSVVEFNVVRFEIRVDEGSPASAGMSVLSGESQGYTTPLPVMPIGHHSLEVRACSSTTCGAWSQPLTFIFSPPFVVQTQRRFGWPSPHHQP